MPPPRDVIDSRDTPASNNQDKQNDVAEQENGKTPPAMVSLEESARLQARAAELKALEADTPLQLDLNSLYNKTAYSEFPRSVFAPKFASTTAAHDFLMNVGHQVYQQALIANEKKNYAYASNAAKILRKIIEVDLNFVNDPAAPQETNDNRYLEAAWFITNIARGALILDKEMPAEWRQAENWPLLKTRLNQWMDSTVRTRADPTAKPMIALIADSGTMRWVSAKDSTQGSTNRTFALLEAQMRVAALRGGALSSVRSIDDIFQEFRGYLRTYFTQQVKCIGDANTPLPPNQLCLKNKDEPRPDTYHVLMGLASIVHILEIGKRFNLQLTKEEQQKVIAGLRWGADHNTPRTGVISTLDVDVWEIPYRLFSAEDLGPLVKRDKDRKRSSAFKKAALAWGYSLIAQGY